MNEATLAILLFACGGLAGWASRPVSGWAALVFSLVLVPLGIGLSLMFC